MTTPLLPPARHDRFEAMCSQVQDFEPLPTVAIEPSAQPVEPGADAEDQPLDGLILAGLVAPY